MFERFTEKARTVVVLAQQDARERGDSAIDTGHLLRALYAVPDNLALMVLEGFSVRRADVEADLAGDVVATQGSSAADADALAALGIDLDEVRRRVEDAFGPGALDRAQGPKRRFLGGHIPFAREAISLGHNYIGTEHVLLALVRGDGAAHDVLVGRGVRLDVARVIVEELVRGRRAG